jgi:hypothetical protein
MKQSVDRSSRRAQLEKEGWKKQTTYDEPRLSELVQMYEETGLEVRLEEPEKSDDCAACYDASAGKLKTIYTREKKERRS